MTRDCGAVPDEGSSRLPGQRQRLLGPAQAQLDEADVGVGDGDADTVADLLAQRARALVVAQLGGRVVVTRLAQLPLDDAAQVARRTLAQHLQRTLEQRRRHLAAVGAAHRLGRRHAHLHERVRLLHHIAQRPGAGLGILGRLPGVGHLGGLRQHEGLHGHGVAGEPRVAVGADAVEQRLHLRQQLQDVLRAGGRLQLLQLERERRQAPGPRPCRQRRARLLQRLPGLGRLLQQHLQARRRQRLPEAPRRVAGRRAGSCGARALQRGPRIVLGLGHHAGEALQRRDRRVARGEGPPGGALRSRHEGSHARPQPARLRRHGARRQCEGWGLEVMRKGRTLDARVPARHPVSSNHTTLSCRPLRAPA